VTSRDVYFTDNPLKEQVFRGRVDGYYVALKDLPTHQGWFSWDIFHKQVAEMVLCEMELEDLDRLIGRDFGGNAWMDKVRANTGTRLDRLRRNLGMTASIMAQLRKEMAHKQNNKSKGRDSFQNRVKQFGDWQSSEV